ASTTAAPATVRQLATACPRCGAAVPSAASDFCEHCSAHLYPGHCVFCLEPFAPGQAHCRHCGLPPEGVVCGACGTFSRFDFCPNPDCGAGLTPRAARELERLAEDSDAVAAFAELDEIGAVLAAVERASAPPVIPPVAAAPVATAAPPAGQPAPAASGQTRPSLAALRAAAKGARSAEEKAKVRALAEQAAEEALRSVSTRTYPTAQEARAAGTALQVALRFRQVSEKLEVIAWRCHAFQCEHPMPGGMSLCSDPSKGGMPITRIIQEIVEGNAEFTV
ncbi:MAG TPA: zinc ribbon domain-containing protein, partial [Gemmatimonadales bacterium]|nr:zinc ribbon domain-containing protein [Gemmatimonadales bacterium]